MRRDGFMRDPASGLWLRPGECAFHGGPVGRFSGVSSGRGVSVATPSTPVISALDPSSGSTAGGETLSVFGSNFQSGDVIRIDGSNQTTAFVSSGLMTCTAPAHAAGSVSVIVRRGAATDSNAVTYEFVTGGGPPADQVDIGHWDGISVPATSDASLLDSAAAVPWNSLSTGNSGVLRVVSASGLGFSTTNCLEVTVNASGQARAVQKTNLPALGTNGDKVFMRYEIRVAAPNPYPPTDKTNHNIENDFGPEGGNWQFRTVMADTDWEIGFGSLATAFPNNRWVPPRLEKNKTYRVEWYATRLSSTTFNAHVRIYDRLTDTLLYDDDDFNNLNSSATLASTPTLTFADVTDMIYVQFGHNGTTGGASPSIIQMYLANFSYRTVDWVGA